VADKAAMCAAMSDPSQPLTVYGIGKPRTVIPATLRGRSRGQWFACTQHKDHRGDHTACDGLGHVLASWPRQKPEKYWHREDCAGCAHHRKARSWLN
jgi:hypothetical protein